MLDISSQVGHSPAGRAPVRQCTFNICEKPRITSVQGADIFRGDWIGLLAQWVDDYILYYSTVNPLQASPGTQRQPQRRRHSSQPLYVDHSALFAAPHTRFHFIVLLHTNIYRSFLTCFPYRITTILITSVSLALSHFKMVTCSSKCATFIRLPEHAVNGERQGIHVAIMVTGAWIYDIHHQTRRWHRFPASLARSHP